MRQDGTAAWFTQSQSFMSAAARSITLPHEHISSSAKTPLAIMVGLLQSHTSAAAPVVDTGQTGSILPRAHELTLLEGMQSLTLASVGPMVAASSPALPIR